MTISFVNRFLFFRLLAFAAPYKKKLFISFLVGLALAGISPIRPFLIQYTVDQYIQKDTIRLLIFICLVQFGLLILEVFLNYFFSFTSSWIGQYVIKDLRKKIFQKIIFLNIKQYDNTPVGVLSTRTVDDTERVNDVFANGILPVMVDIASVLTILGYMFYTNVMLSWIALSPFPLLIIAAWLFKNSVKKSFDKIRSAVAKLNAFTNEQLNGIKTLKFMGGEHSSFFSFNIQNQEHKKQNIKAIFAYSLFFPAVEIISALSVGALVWWAVGKKGTPGEIISFIICINAIFRPLRMIADKFNTIQMGLLAAKRIFSILDIDDMVKGGNLKPERPLKGEIEFKDVHFSYVANNPVLHNISFRLEEKKSLAIVGRTGSGKTSIISLLNRLYQHEKGDVLIDGKKIEEYDLNFLRRQIGYVSQDVFLFSGTIFENIVFGTSGFKESQVKKICKSLHVHDIIEKLPNKYNFKVLDGGINLSSGQRQLISIARVFVKNPSIIIFDEATASIDPKMEDIIDFASEKLFKEKTSIIIAHRYKTILKADQIIVLKRGEIVEQGGHEKLMKTGKYYKTLYQKQFSTPKKAVLS